MSVTRAGLEALRRYELLRYALNGAVASVVHFAVLMINLNVLHLPSAGLANLMAAIVGISVSFTGNRWFVFTATTRPLAEQALRFSGLYGAIAAIHALTLWVWTDVGGLDYRVGFLLAVALQLCLSFTGNKTLVFSR